MSETRFTPGPWRAVIEPASDWGAAYFSRVVDPDGEIIRVHGVALSSGDVAEANAHLLAAAPDLLEIVRDIVSDCKGTINPGLYDLAVAALSKASGTPQ